MAESSGSFWRRPATKPGWWAAGLMIAFAILFILNQAVFMQLTTDAPWQRALLPFYGISMVLCGLASGVVGLIAVIRNRERSWLVWLAILPGAFMLFLLLGEFLVPH